ncbi:hypothetical protein H4R35_001534 [Dimargaris xerosporica]|nr:hypothetical protein H4R35_001534 [Dimargaris xerosporica]
MHSTSPNVLTIGINAVTRLLERLVADQRQTSAQLLSASGKPAALTSRYIVLVPVADITAKMLISHLPILAGLCGPDRVLLLGLPQGCGPELTKALAIKAVSAVAISSQAPDFQPMWQRLQAVHKPARMPWLEPFRPKKSIKAKPLDTSKPTTRTTGTVGVVINPSNQAVDSPGVLGTLTLPPTTSHPPSHGALARCFGSGAVKCVKTTAPMKRSKQKTPKAATSKQ